MEVCLRFWIEMNGKSVMGRGGYEILKAIDEFKSISKASKALGMSYRFVWNYIKRIESVLGEKVVESERGGVEGGKTELTSTGRKLLKLYDDFERTLKSALNGVRGRVERVEGGRIVVSIERCVFNVGDEVSIFKPCEVPRVILK